jgi:hypothetical protein
MAKGKAAVRVKVVATSRGTLLPGPSYLGACDASAAVELGGTRFAIASDEACSDGRHVLHLYERDEPRPVGIVKLGRALGVRAEMDVEAAVRVDARIYWLGSHGRAEDGRAAPARRRFFATELRDGALRRPKLVYADLVEDMLASPELAPLGLAKLEKRRAGPKAGGLNLEGVTARADGALLLGLRSPLLDGRAVLVPLLNPDAVLEGRERARFAAPITFDLQGNGIRDLTYHRVRRCYVILGGASRRGNGRALYVWSGLTGDEAVPVGATLPQDFNAEALFVDEQLGCVRVFSDDGARYVTLGDGKRRMNKQSKDTRRSFRSLWLILE